MTISIRDLSRNRDIFTQYDYIDIEDKKLKNIKVFWYLVNLGTR